MKAIRILKKLYAASGEHYSAYITHVSKNNFKYYFMAGKFNWESYIEPSSSFNPIISKRSDLYCGLGIITTPNNSRSFHLILNIILWIPFP